MTNAKMLRGHPAPTRRFCAALRWKPLFLMAGLWQPDAKDGSHEIEVCGPTGISVCALCVFAREPVRVFPAFV
jgi:putative SOS response-associated peptidase YedK